MIPEFRDPPPPERIYTNWNETLAPLLERPDTWACIAQKGTKQQAVALVHVLRKRSLRRPDGRWEFVSRGSEVFARYLGPEET